MTTPDKRPALIRTELWLTLARAFRPPTDCATGEAVLGILADDLEEMANEAGFEAAESLAGIRIAAAATADAQRLLVDYSSLFLVPPTPAHLNIASYLDGTTNGPAMDGLDLWREHYGLAPRNDFKDRADHLSVQLEFIAWLASHESEAALGQYINDYLLPALPRIIGALDEAGAGQMLYRHLLAYTLDSLQPLAVERAADPRQERRKRRHDTDVGIWRLCDSCGKPYAREKEIGIMTKALALAGLPAEHLKTCPDCRDPLKASLASINR